MIRDTLTLMCPVCKRTRDVPDPEPHDWPTCCEEVMREVGRTIHDPGRAGPPPPLMGRDVPGSVRQGVNTTSRG